MKVPEIDKQIGMHVYLTKTKGIGGKIRRKLEDFIVEELLLNGAIARIKPKIGEIGGEGSHLLCILVKKNWDTLLIIREIARRLGVDPKIVKYAGLKDAKAITAQHISIRGVKPEQILKLNIKNAEITPIALVKKPVSSQALLGNRFTITIREIDQERVEVEEGIAQTMEEISTYGGMANFFSYQRFGAFRPITHLVGRQIVKGNYEEAVRILLAYVSPYETENVRKAREFLAETWDYSGALKLMPKSLYYERIALKWLASHPNDYYGCLKRLPTKLLRLFVHAYQAYLFNKFLSQRLVQMDEPHMPRPGDYIALLDQRGLPHTYLTARKAELNKLKNLVKEGKACLALPLIGTKQTTSSGEQGEIEREILEQEEIEPNNFKVAGFPEARSLGGLRPAFTPIKDFQVVSVYQERGKTQAKIQFTLIKGSYATTLLREIMKPENPAHSGF